MSEHLPQESGADRTQRFTLENAKRYGRNALAAAGVAIVAVVGVRALDGGDNQESASAAGGNVAADCGDINGFADLSANSADYNDSAFLPEADGGIDSPDEANDYLNDNPVVDKENVDPASLAALMSVVTEPATDKKAADPRYDFVENFRENLNAYNGQGGLERAKEDCADTSEVLQKVAGYNDSWAAEGQKVIHISAVRNKNNKVTDMKLKKVIATETMDGIELKLPDDKSESEGTDGFSEILIDEDGEKYAKGVIVEPKDNKENRDKKGGAKKQGDKKGQAKRGAAGGGGSGNGSGGGKSTNRGGGGSGPSTGVGGGGQQGERGGCGGGGCGGTGGGGGGQGGGGGGCRNCGGGGGGPTPTRPAPQRPSAPTPTRPAPQRPSAPTPTRPPVTTSPPAGGETPPPAGGGELPPKDNPTPPAGAPQ